MENRRFGLDLLRSIAILLVVEQHGRRLVPFMDIFFSNLGHTDGVDLFFVLSGFLIGGILIKEVKKKSSINVFRFWLRRWLRTLPNYYVAFFINCIVIFFTVKNLDVPLMIKTGFFVQNYIPPYDNFLFFSEAWSLSIEEHFYLVLPVFLLMFSYLMKRKNLNWTLAPVFVIIGASIVFKCLYYIYHQEEINTIVDMNAYIRTIVPFRLDSLGIGVLAAYVRIEFVNLWQNKTVQKYLLAAGIILMLILDQTWIEKGFIPINIFTCCFYFVLYALAVSFLFPFLDNYTPPVNILTKSVTHVSKISYSMYLYHNSILAIPLSKIAHANNGWTQVLIYLFYWLTVFSISSLTYAYIEKPILNYRDKKISDR